MSRRGSCENAPSLRDAREQAPLLRAGEVSFDTAPAGSAPASTRNLVRVASRTLRSCENASLLRVADSGPKSPQRRSRSFSDHDLTTTQSVA